MGAVVAPGYPLASLTQARVADCMHYPLVLPQRGMELRSRIERMQAHSALELRPMIEVNSIGMLKTILRDGAEVGFLTNADVAADVHARQLVWIPLTDPGIPPSTLSLIVQARRNLSLPASVLVERLEAAFATIEQPVHRPARRRSTRSKKVDAATEK